MNEETALLVELLLHAEIFSSCVEARVDDLADPSDRTELRLKITQCRGLLTELQRRYDDEKLISLIQSPVRTFASF